jgi:hypothetical protein
MIISPFGEDSTDAEFDADSYSFVMIRNICFSVLRGAWDCIKGSRLASLSISGRRFPF